MNSVCFLDSIQTELGDINQLHSTSGIKELILACENGLAFVNVSSTGKLTVVDYDYEMQGKYVVDAVECKPNVFVAIVSLN